MISGFQPFIFLVISKKNPKTFQQAWKEKESNTINDLESKNIENQRDNVMTILQRIGHRILPTQRCLY